MKKGRIVAYRDRRAESRVVTTSDLVLSKYRATLKTLAWRIPSGASAVTDLHVCEMHLDRFKDTMYNFSVKDTRLKSYNPFGTRL